MSLSFTCSICARGLQCISVLVIYRSTDKRRWIPFDGGNIIHVVVRVTVVVIIPHALLATSGHDDVFGGGVARVLRIGANAYKIGSEQPKPRQR
jgi:hypothetical protein